ncbi:dephospho-CoA kinase [Pelistega sp. NLN82]|uniref:Dephospho-CoA kinase n=1 Tax=Pelistega ratti TaxID=2652177 RepID=A0A6L9Y7K9_9BURK|nr:dephospho-CoA kinase [Pelistega ratti]NEN76502.1 dephospho-CoA kinase [Pelistega ratti]
MEKYNQFCVGLTGGIGSGKSTVAGLLEQWGIKVIDADQISRTLTQANGQAIPAIREVFGDGVIAPDHSLNRDAMRQLIFSDVSVKKKLENILHPMIKQEMQKQCQQEKQSPYIVFDIPLLVESIDYYRSWLDRICVVDCDEATQIKRVSKRNALSQETIQRIIQQQVRREERLLYADDIIFNGEGITLDNLQEQAYNFHMKWSLMVNKGV